MLPFYFFNTRKLHDKGERRLRACVRVWVRACRRVGVLGRLSRRSPRPHRLCSLFPLCSFGGKPGLLLHGALPDAEVHLVQLALEEAHWDHINNTLHDVVPKKAVCAFHIADLVHCTLRKDFWFRDCERRTHLAHVGRDKVRADRLDKDTLRSVFCCQGLREIVDIPSKTPK